MVILPVDEYRNTTGPCLRPVNLRPATGAGRDGHVVFLLKWRGFLLQI
ncbi:hypothetical protein LHK_00358 [Laribacter hongkongensis HLHK9]|uniref:Uncharacterized protein n=2 Tax=Laribacter hongkongensis TaxID=168471 RepID=C1DBF6_LARHH|nr:hypothetical protein LHK_00358 [Laribacter hongkongensis HLHK9]ASJ23208.1 hypothetical protein LHGZ1_0377 [Laribacter hongkongensis]